ncbi:MAG: hypothetical protein A2V67_15155 [Deltaproteobacteria bacterium RBG_13_61_14]|nr:MAG: hypothetical protein A2V67_15155 [Deltaproteobacteria bacterium RBG_13_61_14]
MTGKERVLTALNLKEPDRVPVWEMAYNEPSIVGIARHFVDPANLPEPKFILDMTPGEVFRLIGGLIAFIKGLDLDGTTAVSTAPRQRLDQDHVRDAFGIVYHIGGNVGEPYPVDGPIHEPSDLSRYRMREPAEGDYTMLRVLRQALPDVAIAWHAPATFKIAWGLRGSIQQYLMDYLLDPDLAHALARLATDYCIANITRGLDLGADFVILEGDLAHNPGPLMSPKHYGEFIQPYHAEICAAAHRLGKKIVKHSDGKLTALLPHLLDAGFDGIHPIQPQCMDIAETKRYLAGRACVLGNIDCAFLLPFGSEAEVEAAVQETIARAAPGGGYILSSSNSIHPGCKPENYLAMVRAARRWGSYPIAVVEPLR